MASLSILSRRSNVALLTAFVVLLATTDSDASGRRRCRRVASQPCAQKSIPCVRVPTSCQPAAIPIQLSTSERTVMSPEATAQAGPIIPIPELLVVYVKYQYRTTATGVWHWTTASAADMTAACAAAKSKAVSIHPLPHYSTSCVKINSGGMMASSSATISSDAHNMRAETTILSADGVAPWPCHVVIEACYCDGTLICAHGFGATRAEACAEAWHLVCSGVAEHCGLRWSRVCN